MWWRLFVGLEYCESVAGGEKLFSWSRRPIRSDLSFFLMTDCLRHPISPLSLSQAPHIQAPFLIIIFSNASRPIHKVADLSLLIHGFLHSV